MTDWAKLEQLIRASVTGKLADIESEQDLFQAARAEDPERYKEMSERIRKDEQDFLRNSWG